MVSSLSFEGCGVSGNGVSGDKSRSIGPAVTAGVSMILELISSENLTLGEDNSGSVGLSVGVEARFSQAASSAGGVLSLVVLALGAFPESTSMGADGSSGIDSNGEVTIGSGQIRSFGVGSLDVERARARVGDGGGWRRSICGKDVENSNGTDLALPLSGEGLDSRAGNGLLPVELGFFDKTLEDLERFEGRALESEKFRVCEGRR